MTGRWTWTLMLRSWIGTSKHQQEADPSRIISYNYIQFQIFQKRQIWNTLICWFAFDSHSMPHRILGPHYSYECIQTFTTSHSAGNHYWIHLKHTHSINHWSDPTILTYHIVKWCLLFADDWHLGYGSLGALLFHRPKISKSTQWAECLNHWNHQFKQLWSTAGRFHSESAARSDDVRKGFHLAPQEETKLAWLLCKMIRFLTGHVSWPGIPFFNTHHLQGWDKLLTRSWPATHVLSCWLAASNTRLKLLTSNTFLKLLTSNMLLNLLTSKTLLKLLTSNRLLKLLTSNTRLKLLTSNTRLKLLTSNTLLKLLTSNTLLQLLTSSFLSCWPAARFLSCWPATRFFNRWPAPRFSCCWPATRFPSCWPATRFKLLTRSTLSTLQVADQPHASLVAHLLTSSMLLKLLTSNNHAS